MSCTRAAVVFVVGWMLACGGEGAPEAETVAVPVAEPAPVVVAAPTPEPDLVPAPRSDAPASATPRLDALAGLERGALYEAAKAVRWEPYTGVLRGPEGTLATGAGNALDQAFLVLTLFERAGRDARFAQGSLSDEQAEALLTAWAGAPGPFDAALRGLASAHTWVEVEEEDGSWTSYDPVLGTPAGTAPAEARTTTHSLAEREFHALTFVLKVETASGEVRTQGPFGGPTARLDAPIAVTALATPLWSTSSGPPAPDRSIGSPVGGGSPFGGLGGRPRPPPAPAAPAAADPVRVGTEWTWEVDLTGDPKRFTVKVTDDDAASRVVREWMEVTTYAPGSAPRTTVRALHEGDGPAPEWRRYDLVVVRGPVERARVTDEVKGLDAAGWKARAEALAKAAPAGEVVADGKALVAEAGSAVGPRIGHLFAAESDAHAAAAAKSFGVALTHPEARLFVVSQEVRQEGSALVSRVALDLRHDPIGAWALPGTPASGPRAFQAARGMLESALEGALVAALTDRPAATTVRVMEAAGREGVAVQVATPAERRAIDGVKGLGDADRARLIATLDAGRHVVIPSRAVAVDGVPTIGWWDVDPVTGAFVGVLQGGQNQSMVSYTVTLEKVGVNDEMAYVLGLLVGASGTQWLIAANMLRYGEITEAVKEDIRAMMARMLCAVCPSAQASVGAGASVGADCYEAFSVGDAIGVGGSIAFCDNYAAGVECAMAVMLDGIGSQTPGIDVDVGGTLTIPWSCD